MAPAARSEHAGARSGRLTDIPISRSIAAPRKPLTSAERQRAFQRRIRRGEKVLKIVVKDYYGLISLLLDLGRITEAEAQDPDLVAAAVSVAINDLTAQKD